MGGHSHRHGPVDDRLSIADTGVANPVTHNDAATDPIAHSNDHWSREWHLDRNGIRFVQC